MSTKLKFDNRNQQLMQSLVFSHPKIARLHGSYNMLQPDDHRPSANRKIFLQNSSLFDVCTFHRPSCQGWHCKKVSQKMAESLRKLDSTSNGWKDDESSTKITFWKPSTGIDHNCSGQVFKISRPSCWQLDWIGLRQLWFMVDISIASMIYHYL